MEESATRKTRTVLPPDQRRAAFVELARELFRSKGYEATTINDVIIAAGVSKGAFYHHFKAKEDLLEAVVADAATKALAYFEGLEDEPGLDALARLNRLLTTGSAWKLAHMGELRRTFETTLHRDDGVLTTRIFEAVLEVLSPAIASLIAQGQSDGSLGAGDPAAMADALLWINYGRERMTGALIGRALQDPEAFVVNLHNRLRAEQAIMERILGVSPGSIHLIGTLEEVRQFVSAWRVSPAIEGQAG